MNSIPKTSTMGKTATWTLTLTPMRWAIAALLILLAGVLLASGTIVPRWNAYLGECAQEDLEAREKAAGDAALASRDEGVKARLLLEQIKKDPEKYRGRFERTYYPSEADMADWARGEAEIGVAYTGTLRVSNLVAIAASSVGSPAASVQASSCGASVSITDVPSFIPNTSAYVDTPKVASEDAGWRGYYYVYTVTVTAPGMGGATDTHDVALWVGDGNYGMPLESLPVGIERIYENSLSVAWAITLDGAYRQAKIETDVPADHAYSRDARQRTGTGHWFADADTTVTVAATVSGESLSANGNYGAGSETDLTEAIALGITPSIALNYAPDTHTDYASVSINAGADTALDFSNWTFYRVTGDDGDWHWMGDTTEEGYDPTPDAEDILWYTHPDGNTISIRAGDAYASGGESWAALTAFVAGDLYCRLWKQNKNDTGDEAPGVYRYDTYDDSEGHPFEIGRYRKPGQTAADVSVAPDWDEPVRIRETWTFGDGGIPADKWRFLTNTGDGLQVHIREPWMTANNENVPFTDPTDMKDYPRYDPETETQHELKDILQALTFHPLDGEIDEPPWRDDWITWVRTERNLDIPPGANERPSQFTGVGAVTVLSDVWTIPAGGGIVERTLATRRRNRLLRMNAHLWTGSGDQQEVSDYWPLMTRANLDIGVTGDDPKWWDPEEEPWSGEEVGVEYEDITDWRNFSCVELTATGVDADQTVTLRLTYRTLSGTNPYYTGAQYKYGTADGEFESEWSEQQTAEIETTLYASTGKAKWDLGPDAGNAPLDLELVEKVEFVFSAADAITFSSWRTVPYAGDGNDEVRMRIAHKCSTDYWGAGHWTDGMPNYQPTYLSPFASDRVEVGFYSQQDAQHNPLSGLTTDLRSLKSLSAWVSEQLWGEVLLEPTYETATIAAALEDADENTLGTPVFGDYDEDGFALHVGTDMDCWFPLHTVYCDVILQGGARGIAKRRGVRQVSREDAVRLYYTDDSGAHYTHIGDADTDAYGMYRIGAGREKTPREYQLRGVGTYDLGSFVNAEEHWAAVQARSEAAPGAVSMFRHPAGNIPCRAWIDADDNIQFAMTDNGRVVLGTKRLVDDTGDFDAVDAESPGAYILIEARHAATRQLHAFTSNDNGRTWTKHGAVTT